MKLSMPTRENLASGSKNFFVGVLSDVVVLTILMVVPKMFSLAKAQFTRIRNRRIIKKAVVETE